MKKRLLNICVLLLITVILFGSLSGCSSNKSQDFFGKYTFKEVSYLSGLSSSTIDYLNEQMAGTVYTIEADSFKIEAPENIIEINSPSYVYLNKAITDALTEFSDMRSFSVSEVENQYTIMKKDGSSTHLRLYTSSNSLWIASYSDNTVDGSEIIMYIYKLSK